MNNLISCNFMGGLGNQLFQSAHALSQGWKHNRPVVFTPNSFTPGQGRGTENYLKNIFRNLNFTNQVNEFVTVSEPSFEYSGVSPKDENTSFYGYFQSTKNWFGFNDRIRDMFQPDEETLNYFYSKYPKLSNPNTLSIHVRRSEYLKLSHIHPTITLEYLSEAIKKIQNISTVFVFSDDHEFVNKNLSFPDVVFVEESEDYMELWLMGLCQNHIISNSTFSWWGTFLNKNTNKKIVAPSVWFGPEGPNAKDIYEQNWDLIDVEYINGELKLKK